MGCLRTATGAMGEQGRRERRDGSFLNAKTLALEGNFPRMRRFVSGVVYCIIMKTITIFLISVLFLCPAASAESVPEAEIRELRKAAEDFMQDLFSTELESALKKLFQQWWINPAEAEEMTGAMAAQLLFGEKSWSLRFEKHFGKPLPQAFEFVGVRTLGMRMARVGYLGKGSRMPCEFAFGFYRTEQGWKLIDISVGDRARELINLLGVATMKLQPAEVTVQKDARNFINTISKGGAQEAMELLLKTYSPAATNHVEAAEDFASARRPIDRQLREFAGKPAETEFVGVVRTSPDFLRFLFLQNYEKGSFPWSISFYRGSEGWRLKSYLANPEDEALALDLRRLATNH